MIKPFSFRIDRDFIYDIAVEDYDPDDNFYNDQTLDDSPDEVIFILYNSWWFVGISKEGMVRVPDVSNNFDVDGEGHLDIIGVDII